MVSIWIRSLEDLEESIELWTKDLSQEDFFWIAACDLNPIAGLIKHIAGSSKRLLSYAQGIRIDEKHKPTAAQEMKVQGISPQIILENFKTDLDLVKKGILAFDDKRLNTMRKIGNYETELKAAFILQHLVEHAQLHLGQIIVISKLIKS